MTALRPYILPIKGLKTGIHEYAYEVGPSFFAAFPDSPVQHAALKLAVTVDRRHGELVIDFDFSGTIRSECDRCLAEIDLPVAGKDQLLVQFSTDSTRESTDPQLVLISPDEHQLNLATYAYEFFLLSLPIIKTYECRTGAPPYPCDDALLNKFEQLQHNEEEVADEEKADKPSPWDALKNWKQD